MGCSGSLGSKRFVIGVVLLLLSAACGGTTVDQTGAPDPVPARCQIALTSSSADVPYTGQQLSVGLSAERECAWTARSDATWAQVTPGSGQGDAALTIAVATSSVQTTRTATITVDDKTVRITQAAAPPPPPVCTITLTPPSRSVDDNGVTTTLAITVGPTCTWKATVSDSWITLLTPDSGTGATTMIYRVARNQSRDSRTGTITVNGQQHVIQQAGR